MNGYKCCQFYRGNKRVFTNPEDDQSCVLTFCSARSAWSDSATCMQSWNGLFHLGTAVLKQCDEYFKARSRLTVTHRSQPCIHIWINCFINKNHVIVIKLRASVGCWCTSMQGLHTHSINIYMHANIPPTHTSQWVICWCDISISRACTFFLFFSFLKPHGKAHCAFHPLHLNNSASLPFLFLVLLLVFVWL